MPAKRALLDRDTTPVNTNVIWANVSQNDPK
jgi:hypothetical protein